MLVQASHNLWRAEALPALAQCTFPFTAAGEQACKAQGETCHTYMTCRQSLQSELQNQEVC